VPFNGGLSPYPERSGGGRPQIGRLIDSLVAQLGSAYDGSSGTTVYAYAEAYARAISEVYSTNARLGHQWDPARMTDFLPRWEAILGLYPLTSDTLLARRNRVAAAMKRIGGLNTYEAMVDALTNALAPISFTVIHGSSATANVWTPAGWPMGNHPTTAAQPDFYSTVAQVTIVVSEPAGMTDADFYSRLGAIYTVLDPMLPAWVTWNWIRQDIHPGSGFYLDEVDLDNEAFDT
jgi:hypothetical protein